MTNNVDIVEPTPNPQGNYKRIGPRTYQKYDPVMGVRTTIWIEDAGNGKVNIKKRHEQRTDDIIALNKLQANSFGGFKQNLMTQTARVPVTIWSDFMRKCGQDKRTGEYDKKRLTRILNDSDYKHLKTVDKRL